MLNPGATEFKPALSKPLQTDTPSKDTNIKSSSSTQTNKHDNKTSTRSNKSRNQKSAFSAASTNATKIPDSTSKDRSNGHGGRSTTTTNTGSASHSLGDHPKTPGKKQSLKQRTSTTPSSTLHQQKKSVRQTRPQQQQRPTSHTTSNTESVFLVEQQPATSFITIDQPIDPVHVIPGAQALKNTIIHGYDRYIAWIERCLQAHAVVTLVGMDPAISDVLSLATIIQAKGIGSYHELATFSMDEPGGGRQHQHPISGIQLKLHRN